MLSLQLRLIALAIGLHSRLPVGAHLRAWAGAHPASIRRCERYLPVAGLVISLLTALIYAMCALTLPHPVAVLVAMTAGLMLSGTRDHGAMAAAADAIGTSGASGAPGAQGAPGTSGARGAHDASDGAPEAAMPRVGTRGVIALAMLLLLNYETLSSIDPSWIGVTMVSAGTFSRGIALVLAGRGRADAARARDAGLQSPERSDDVRSLEPAGSPVDDAMQRFDAWAALTIALMPVCALAWWTEEWGLFMLSAALATGCAAWFRHIHVRHLSFALPDGLRAHGMPPPPGSLRLVAEAAFMIGILASLAVIDEVVADPAS